MDQAELMPDSPRYHNDIRHFTAVGSAAFVENLMGVVLSTFDHRAGASEPGGHRR